MSRVLTPTSLRAVPPVSDANVTASSQPALPDAAEHAQAFDALIATVTHDVCNPLNVLYMGVEGLRRHAAAGEPADPRLAERMQRALDRVDRLLRDLVVVSGARAGRLPLDVQPNDASLVAREAMDAVRSAAAAKSIAVVLEPARGPLEVHCDLEAVARSISALIENAVKFTPTGGRVTVSTERVGGGVRFWVRDTGPGIPEADREAILAGPWSTRTHGRGARPGLGLAAARGVAEAHGGALSLEHSDTGAAFALSIPERPP